jgi:putative ABC transport system substrate-binding protein
MRRRAFISLLGGAAVAWPLAAWAQQSARLRRIAVVIGYAGTDIETQSRVGAFRQKLQELGWTEGRNIEIDFRATGADPERIRAQAQELVARAPEVIVASPGQVVLALRDVASAIPIVFANVPDPVGIGIVSGLAHPGGDITGFTSTESALAGKWLEVLKEIGPAVKRVLVIYSPVNPAWPGRLRVLEQVAPAAGVQLTPAAVQEADDIERALTSFAREPNGGIILFPSIFTSDHRDIVVAAAARHRLPAMYPYRAAAVSGGLISYGIDIPDQFRGAASYVDRILKGEKAGDLPIQAPTKYELVVNLKAAKALGLEVSPMLLARADEVIE